MHGEWLMTVNVESKALYRDVSERAQWGQTNSIFIVKHHVWLSLLVVVGTNKLDIYSNRNCSIYIHVF